jgi:protocatechuate 3,4-dioxygenase beta subunit
MTARTLHGLEPQEGRATCRGVVTDPNGSVVPGARVTLVNEKTKYKRVKKTDDEGQYNFGLLEPGLYTLTVKYPSFDTFQREHLSLHSNEELRLDVLLDVGLMGVIVCEEPPSKGVVIDGVRVKID